MKIKSLMYVLMGTMLVTTSCSDNELEKGNDGSGTVDPVNASALVNYIPIKVVLKRVCLWEMY